jgi:hypothetical protein
MYEQAGLIFFIEWFRAGLDAPDEVKFAVFGILRNFLLFFLAHLELWLSQFIHEIVHLQVKLRPNCLQLFTACRLSILKLHDHLVNALDVSVSLFDDAVFIFRGNTVDIALHELLHVIEHRLGRVMNREAAPCLFVMHVNLGRVL